MDDLTVPIGVVRPEQKDQLGTSCFYRFKYNADSEIKDSSRNTLIISSERSRWHESLVDENDSWIRDFGAVPEISDALQRIEIKYVVSRLIGVLAHLSPVEIGTAARRKTH